LSFISSPIKHILLWQFIPHSKVIWLALLPINLIKCQYFLADKQSNIRLLINSLYNFVLLSKPNDVSKPSLKLIKSLSIVFGTPITQQFILCYIKSSASKQALVLLSSPPIITSPFKFSF